MLAACGGGSTGGSGGGGTGNGSSGSLLPDTGQKTCWLATGTQTDCPGTGQDGEFAFNPMSFTDNGDGTVTDNVTGLMWQKCSAGQANDAACTGSISLFNWYEATGTPDATYNDGGLVNTCGDLVLGTHTDWRLPTPMELYMLGNINTMDFAAALPAIDETYFPNTDKGWYWTSVTSPTSASNAWYVYFNSPRVSSDSKSNSYAVRCVRGAESAQSFTDNGNGTVTDNVTGLMWQQSGDTGATWQGGLDYCNSLSLGNHDDWRLPDVKELYSLVDAATSYPAINETYFPGTMTSSEYWTSTTDMDAGTSIAFRINFQFGTMYSSITKNDSYYIRCVR